MWTARAAAGGAGQRGPSGQRLRLAQARGSLEHDLALKEASGEPAGRGVSCLVFLIGAAVDDQLVELWQWSKDISKTDKESGVEARLKPKGPKDDWLGFTWFGDFDIYK